MFSKEAQELAKPCYEALKKIAERQGEKCSRCNGLGTIYSFGKEVSACFICHGTGKVKGKWKWKPEVGEWCLWKDKPYVIYEVEENIGPDIGYRDTRIAAPYDFHYVMRKNLTPILHWEKIEEILKQLGYVLTGDSWLGDTYNTWIYSEHDKFFGDPLVMCNGKTRQLAVMRAVIELGKESSNEKD